MKSSFQSFSLRVRKFLFRYSGENAPSYCDFAPESLPWIDRPGAQIEDIASQFNATSLFPFDIKEKLSHWRECGFVILENAIEHQLIDQFERDLGRKIENREKSLLEVDIWHPGYADKRIRRISELPKDILLGPHLKFLQVDSEIPSAKKLMTHPAILLFLNAVFGEKAAPKQSLTFRYGSQQEVHQDYAYVVPSIPAHLAASWIALEDIHPDSGPLFYFLGSHRIKIFDFGNGSFLSPDSTKSNEDFVAHIKSECEKQFLERKTLLLKKGDVLIWHAALAHGGEAIRNFELTRKSLVTHYTTLRASSFPSLR